MNLRIPYLLLSGGAIALIGFGPENSYAQLTAPGEPALTTDEIKAKIDATKTANRDPYDQAEQKKLGFSVGDFLILPQLSVGSVYNDNLYASKTNEVTGWGMGIQPEVTIKRFTGINNTTVQLYGDILEYFNVSSASIATGGAALTHVYEIEHDLAVTFKGEVARRQDQGSAYSATGTGAGYTGVNVEPISYMAYSTSLDVTKNFNSAFVSGGAGLLDYNYGNAQTTAGLTLSQEQRDLFEYFGHIRAGLRVLGDGYTFVESTATQYNFGGGAPSAAGYTIVAGVGADRLSLFRGELYAGYEYVGYQGGQANTSSQSGATFGGRLSWTPTRDLLATLTASQAYTPSTLVSGSVGSLTKSDSISLSVTYNYSRTLDLQANAGYSNVNYSPNPRIDKISQVGISSTYYLFDPVGIRLQYSFSNVNSNQSIFSYGRNLVLLSAAFRL